MKFNRIVAHLICVVFAVTLLTHRTDARFYAGPLKKFTEMVSCKPVIYGLIGLVTAGCFFYGGKIIYKKWYSNKKSDAQEIIELLTQRKKSSLSQADIEKLKKEISSTFSKLSTTLDTIGEILQDENKQFALSGDEENALRNFTSALKNDAIKKLLETNSLLAISDLNKQYKQLKENNNRTDDEDELFVALHTLLTEYEKVSKLLP